MTVLLTPRIQLQKPDGNELMKNGDDILSSNYAKIDLNCHQRIVTNTADIVSPYEGQSIYATAPAQNYVRKGGVWVQVSGPPPTTVGGARGSKGSSILNGELEVDTGLIDVLVASVTFTSELSRPYLVHWNMPGHRNPETNPPSVSNGWIDAAIRWNTGATVNNTHTLVGRKEYRTFSAHGSVGLTTTGHDMNGFIEFTPNIAGQITVGLFTQSHSVSQLWWINYLDRYQSGIHVMDWGN